MFKLINSTLSFVNLILFYLITKNIIKDEVSAILSACFLAIQPINILFSHEITFHNFELIVLQIASLIGLKSIKNNKPYYLALVGMLVASIYNGGNFYIAVNCLFMSFTFYTKKRINALYYYIPFFIVFVLIAMNFDYSLIKSLYPKMSFSSVGYITILKSIFEMLIIPLIMLYLIYEKRYQFEIGGKNFLNLFIGFIPLLFLLLFKDITFMNLAINIAIIFIAIYAGAYIKYSYSLNKNYKLAIVVFLFSNLAFANYINYYQTEHKPILNTFVSAISQNIGAEDFGTKVASDNIVLAKFATKVKAEFSCIEINKKHNCNNQDCKEASNDKIVSQYYDYIVFSANMNEDDEVTLRRESVINNYRLIYQETITANQVKTNTPVRKYLIYKALRLM
ncbi:MAG: hypothetical protein NTW25_14860 [Candidatus Kapabacteria bacterium]|nr:hypothetical protein [Candidatus Kapabacteria bacterium]